MSNKASSVAEVEKAEFPLTEEGLTSLAKTLVQSGRMSAPSFSNWCGRVGPQASRWSNYRKSKGSSKAEPGPSGSKATDKPAPEKSAKTPVKEVKKNLKLSGFKKVNTGCNASTWEEVESASDADMTRWLADMKVIRCHATNRSDIANQLSVLGLTEDEIKQSRSWFPFLPVKKDLYDSITITTVANSGATNTDQSTALVSVPSAGTATSGNTLSESSTTVATGTASMTSNTSTVAASYANAAGRGVVAGQGSASATPVSTTHQVTTGTPTYQVISGHTRAATGQSTTLAGQRGRGHKNRGKR